jgi:hypothetical protein
MVQEVGWAVLRDMGVSLVAVDSPQAFLEQRVAIEAYAASCSMTVAAEFYDAAVSWADPVLERDDSRDMLDKCAEMSVKVILVENASRFARDVVVQETELRMLQGCRQQPGSGARCRPAGCRRRPARYPVPERQSWRRAMVPSLSSPPCPGFPPAPGELS